MIEAVKNAVQGFTDSTLSGVVFSGDYRNPVDFHIGFSHFRYIL